MSQYVNDSRLSQTFPLRRKLHDSIFFMFECSKFAGLIVYKKYQRNFNNLTGASTYFRFSWSQL